MRARDLILAFALWLLATPLAAQSFADGQIAMLRAMEAIEVDPDRRVAISTSLSRLEALGPVSEERVLVVNIPAFELTLWEGDIAVDRWRVIVGKPSTKTPEFRAEVESVIVNPWWNIPDSIVRESVGALVRNRPDVARSRGYVWSGGKYRQRPGPNNALGLIKLVLPNRYSVGMHDTPSRELFEEDVRAFSHGCIRVQHIDRLAARLLDSPHAGQRIADLIEAGRTVQLILERPVPVVVGYFPAEMRDGKLVVYDDIYRRQQFALATERASGQCANTSPTGHAFNNARVVPPNTYSPSRE